MSGCSEDGASGNNNDLEAFSNKKDSEKKRREQENFYIEELAMLISSQIPDISDSEDSSGIFDSSKLEKGSILQDTVDKLRKLNQDRHGDIQREEISSSRSFLPKEILGSLVLEALDGFMFIISNEGNIDFVSDNVLDYLNYNQEEFLSHKSIFNLIHVGDQARFRVNLEPDTWRTWKRLPQNTIGRQGFDRSKVFNLRFKVNSDDKLDSFEDVPGRGEHYENMQVSAIVMSNSFENSSEDPKSGLFCIARRISRNERSGLTPVEQFTTKCHRQTLEIQVVDTEGLPSLYKKSISAHVLGKSLPDLVHPQDRPLMKQHVEAFLKNITDTSRVYRMAFPPPLNIIHVKTKTKDFRPQPGHSHPGYLMSTHNIIRENELQIEDLPAMRPELAGSAAGDNSFVLSCPQSSPSVQTLQSPASTAASSVSSSHSTPVSSHKSEMLERLLSPPPPTSPRTINKSPASSQSTNELLKGLLQQKAESPSNKSKSQPEETITIGQLLNERKYTGDSSDSMRPQGQSELLLQLRKPPKNAGKMSDSELKILLTSSSSPRSDLKRYSTLDEGPKSKQQPSLEALLSVRPENRPIPPPVPRKWSETPQENLPRDIVIDKPKDGTLSRNNNSRTVGSPGQRSQTPVIQQSTPRSTRAPVSKVNVVPHSAPSVSVPQVNDDGDAAAMIDLLTDPVLSKILEGVEMGIDVEQNSDQNLAKQKILEIEQSLLSSYSGSGSSGASSQSRGQSGIRTSNNMIQQQQQQQQQSQPYPGVIKQGNQTQHKILQHRTQGNVGASLYQIPVLSPRSPSLQGANMEELLKGIPPNVSIPTNDPAAGQSRGVEKQLSSPGMSVVISGAGGTRHLSGDGGLGQSREYHQTRHLSGDQIFVQESRRKSADISLPQFPGTHSQPDNRGALMNTSHCLDNTIMTGPVNSRPAKTELMRKAPGGRALSQEDLESFGLSIEVNSDFDPANHQSTMQQSSASQFSSNNMSRPVTTLVMSGAGAVVSGHQFISAPASTLIETDQARFVTSNIQFSSSDGSMILPPDSKNHFSL